MYTNQLPPETCLSRDVFTYHGQCDKVEDNFYKIHPRKKDKSIGEMLT